MNTTMEKIVSLAKRKGFVFQNSEIYGGIQGFYDYGPLGIRFKNNLKREWMKEMTQRHEHILPIEGAIITHPKVWEASGHIENFTDPLVECKTCHKRFRADHLAQTDDPSEIEEKLKGRKCPACGGELTPVRKFNLMVETSLGVIEGDKRTAYLKAEACQTIYLDYDSVLKSSNTKIPFGIVQIGKAFRNEITPGPFLYRQKEFEQWDLQWFTRPDEMDTWYEYWKAERMNWYKGLFSNTQKLRFREHAQDELAHYAKKAFDIEYESVMGWKEMEGIHWRGDWDLKRHGEYSGKDLSYFDEKTQERFIPWIVETSGGVDRTFLFLLMDAYTEEEVKGKIRVVLKIRPDLAPYQAAVLPLVSNKEAILQKAKEIYAEIKDTQVSIFDENGSIGKRYRRQDEIGTPYCITIDYQTVEDNTVTLRDRDTMVQERVPAGDILQILTARLTQ